jgi:N-acetylglucosaminyldiphosphoundecaprenol N-acetyl-beta-D-mannosaminyltransferase
MVENVLGYSIYANDRWACVDDIFKRITNGCEKTWLACLNPHSYVVALKDKLFKKALNNVNWLVPDGIGIVYASKTLGGGISERITGSDIYFGLLERMNKCGNMSVFFLGSTEETLAVIRERIAIEYSNIYLAGTYSPPYKDNYTEEELSEMIEAVNSVKPDVLWVGMTAPKQEKWIANNISRLNVRFIGAIGAVFDFYAGKVKRSKPVFQRLGLEWLPRLINEPKRLWRRTFVSAPIFILHTGHEKIRLGIKGTLNKMTYQKSW